MNYMKQVAEMLGVEMGERFDVKDEYGDITADCFIDENGLHNNCIDLVCTFERVLNGSAEIIKRPFRPNCNEEYWFVSCDGDVQVAIVDGETTFDLMAIYMGNCFRTEAEAAAHKDEIMAKFREVMGDT